MVLAGATARLTPTIPLRLPARICVLERASSPEGAEVSRCGPGFGQCVGQDSRSRSPGPAHVVSLPVRCDQERATALSCGGRAAFQRGPCFAWRRQHFQALSVRAPAGRAAENAHYHVFVTLQNHHDGGRWNRPGRPIVYAASSAALAVLEVRVHLDLPPALLPDDYLLLTIDLRDLAIEAVVALPADPAAFGDAWRRDQRSAVLRVPSLIVPESPNLLFNPAHPDAARARIVAQRRFVFDRRLWLPL